ncbi:MAG TPA: TetR/AcrR family transcriptional regulator [Steroidobacteraceae bacterium]|nr:TetR/AcrR family transcriptional regulator [Steroidobacteraceae bacterium]
MKPPPPDTRTRLVLAALRLFWEKGYGSTSIADVLQAAKVNSGSLYHFFPGKQDLLLAVLDRYHAGIRTMLLEPAWRGVRDPIERVFALLARYRRSLADTDCSYGCPIGSLALELHEPDPAVRERLAANFSAWIEAIQECLQDAGARLPRAVDRRELAAFVLTTMEGAVMQARTFRSLESFDASVRQLRAYFEQLLRQVPDPHRAANSRNNTKERR